MKVYIHSDDKGVKALYYSSSPKILELLRERLPPIAEEIASDTRSRAAEHIRFMGLRPGDYVKSFYSGLSMRQPNKAIAFIRSGEPIARWLENGFTISDMCIFARIAMAMKFVGNDENSISYRLAIHRHMTCVKPYPALGPAFEARRSKIMSMLSGVARDAGQR